MDWAKTTARREENQLSFVIWCAYIRDFMVEPSGAEMGILWWQKDVNAIADVVLDISNHCNDYAA